MNQHQLSTYTPSEEGAKYVNRDGKLSKERKHRAQGYAAKEEKTNSENILHRLQRDRWNSTAAASATASVSCVFFFRQLLGLGPGLLRKNPAAAHQCG